MKEIFADTNYWIGSFLDHDQLHEIAVRVGKKVLSDSSIITSDFVIIEVLNALSTESFETKKNAITIFDEIRSNRAFLVISCSQELLIEANRLYLSRDKEWSIVDCTSFIIMRERKIRSALTYDRHFEQAGFHALLRE